MMAGSEGMVASSPSMVASSPSMMASSQGMMASSEGMVASGQGMMASSQGIMPGPVDQCLPAVKFDAEIMPSRIPFEIVIVDPDVEFCFHASNAFAHFPQVQVLNSLFQEVPLYDCLVCAANPSGQPHLSALETAAAAYFGPEYVARIQQGIRDHFNGEQPVGSCFVASTGCAAHPFVAHAACYPYNHQPIGFLAMSAVLRAIEQHNGMAPTKIVRAICPGLGTFRGNTHSEKAANEMADAYMQFLQAQGNNHQNT